MPRSQRPAARSINRRSFLKGAGAALAGGAAALLPGRAQAGARASLPAHPNFLFIITDQERGPRSWMPGWETFAAGLTGRTAIAAKGLSFTRACCNSAMCSPSRATLLTGRYPAEHGVTDTLTTGAVASTLRDLAPSTPNMATVLASAGYNVQYRGKWHLSRNAYTADATPAQVAAYGFNGWGGVEAGEDADPANFGGGCADHDTAFKNEVVDFLTNTAPGATQPWALFASFANPHDVLSYPRKWNYDSGGGCTNYGPASPGCFVQGIDLPATNSENLAGNYKPTAHKQTLDYLAAGLGTLLGVLDPKRYLNFYAYLHKVVDSHIAAVYSALAANTTLLNNTIVIRLADHGEMGLAHGGLRQKMFNAYEETLSVPLVISNPVLFPTAKETDQLASLVDLVPTVATLAGVTNPGQWNFRGRDLTPIVDAAAANTTVPTVNDSVLFTFDDRYAGSASGTVNVDAPQLIRCLREPNWKFAWYFDPAGRAASQFELYDLANDPNELQNLANPAHPQYNAAKTAEMWDKLAARMSATHTLPYRVNLPLVQRP